MTPAQSIFWSALWAGMASPAYVYAQPNAYSQYSDYSNLAAVSDSVAVVGLQLRQAFTGTQDGRG